MKRCLPICLLLLSFSAYGALNKWVDEDGKVHYSDVPPPDNVQKKALAVPRDPASGVPATKTYIELDAERKRNQKADESAAQKAAQQEDEALTKKKNCIGAKANLMALEKSPQIETYNEKGERVLMDDAARRQNIEEARKQISIYCKTE